MNKVIILIPFLFITVLTITNCGLPSYPQDKVEQAVVDLVKKETGLASIAKLSGTTFYLKAQFPGLVTAKPEIPKKVLNKINVIVTAITRVALSSNAKIDFLVVMLEIPKWNTMLTLTQRLEDIKWSIYQKISIGHAGERVIYDLSSENSELTAFKPITMRDFTSRLLVSKFNWLVSSNPFLSTAFNGRLEIKDIYQGTLVLKLDISQAESAAVELAAEILREWSAKISKKYNEQSITDIEVVNNHGNVILKIPGHTLGLNTVSN